MLQFVVNVACNWLQGACLNGHLMAIIQEASLMGMHHPSQSHHYQT